MFLSDVVGDLEKINFKLNAVVHFLSMKISSTNQKIVCSFYLQKQPSRGVPWKRCSENMQQIYRRIPIPKSDSNMNKVVKQFY